MHNEERKMNEQESNIISLIILIGHVRDQQVLDLTHKTTLQWLT